MRGRNRILLAVVWTWAGVAANAADGPGVSVYSTAPAALAAGPCASPAGCATSGGGLSRYTAGWRGVPDCNAQCDKSRFSKSKPPYAVNLCPGACFGYFQTQWRSWNEVCPHPYDGGIVLDPMRQPIPPAAKNGDAIPPPRVADPKAGTPIPPPPPGMGLLPSIPPYPGPSGR